MFQSSKNNDEKQMKKRRQELWLVTRTNNDDGDSGNDVNGNDNGSDNFIRNVTSSKKIASLEELKEAIAWLESSSSPGTDQQIQRRSQLPTNNFNGSDHTNHSGKNSSIYESAGEDVRNSFALSNSHTNTSNEVFLDEVKRFELFHSVIQHEDDLLNQRVSWIILAQSFLMAPFITESENNNQEGGSNGIKYIAATVGLITVIVTMPAILAAGRNIELQQHIYFTHIRSDERCRELHGHFRNVGTINSNEDIMLEHKLRMENGHIFPNVVFRGRGAVPIVATVTALAILQVTGWLFFIITLVLGW